MEQERRAGNIELHETVAVLKTLMTEARNDTAEIKRMLEGNGQPGLIQRITSLENWRWYLAGIATVSGLLASAIELYAHFGGKH